MTMTGTAHPPTFHANLTEAYGEVAITLDEPPILAFSRPPFGFTRPLPLDALRDLAGGQFGADFDAQLRACTLPPSPPFSEADRARIVRLAADAWAALGPRPAESITSPAAPATVAGGPAEEIVASARVAGEVDPEHDGDETEMRPVAASPTGTVTIAGTAIAAPGDAPVPPPARRALKVVLTLQPDGPDTYRALIGVGADGCDPHFAAAGPPLSLTETLAAVPAIVATAEARWQAAPRYAAATRPTPAPTPVKGTTAARSGAAKATKPGNTGAGATPTTAPTTPEQPPTPAKPAAKQQISLFG